MDTQSRWPREALGLPELSRITQKGAAGVVACTTLTLFVALVVVEPLTDSHIVFLPPVLLVEGASNFGSTCENAWGG